ncbi:polymorphic toxin-type HINT domain-containing protein [Streptomyces sp. NPDC053048]|uniref:polymorphic toxin-type HINT domain-containing protein n=1 Tax=Streptomyces sp. NPDC053048 TaxID=3365694 RepID=UPI0037D4C86C
MPSGRAKVELAPSPKGKAASLAARGSDAKPERAGELPVYLKPVAPLLRSADVPAQSPQPSVDVEMLDQKALAGLGAQGPVVKLNADGAVPAAQTSPKASRSMAAQGKRAPPQSVDVELDYSSYAQRFGGDWGSRLRLVQLPACAATTPNRADCAAGTPLTSQNNPVKQRLSARVALSAGAPMMLAATADGAGSTGDYGATSLSPSGSWAAGGHAGGFSWTHPVESPDVPGGPEPEVKLGYSSQAIDGRTASTNNQASWIGEGWDYHPGFVERRYKSCTKDMGNGANNKTKTGDLCWFADSLTLSLDGSSNELVRDDKSGEWKLADDDGARIELKKGADNGDNDGEHWVLTTKDGTQYWFGLNRLPGWGAGKPETNSAFTVPVFGNHSGEPCHADAFDKSGCAQAWRWNLDYVVDPHGNAMSLWWEKETNHYGQLGKGDKPAAYDRGGYLTRIDYGQRADSLFSAKAAARVNFTTAERCLPSKDFDCSLGKLNKENAKHWPDVPFDLKCDITAKQKCANQLSPSFWTTKRLTQITTEALVGDSYAKADTFELTQQFPNTDATSPALWLASITRTGHTGGTDTKLPPVTFRGEMMDNRVDGYEGIPPFARYRIHAVDTEHGSTVGVTYSARECSAMPGKVKLPTPHDNGMRCYPLFWTPPGADKPIQDWFHKYVVTEVREEDNVTDAQPKVTSYQYLGTPAWAWDDNELADAKERTWSQYRGYAKVRTLTGRGDDGKRAMTESLYFQGMDGDPLPDGKKRSAEVVDSESGKVADLPQFAGQLREEVKYLDEDGQVESSTRLTGVSNVTATRDRKGTTPLHARMGHPETTEERTRKADGGWSRNKETIAYDEYGLPVRTHDFGNVDDPDDDACSTVTYARNPGKWILDLESQEKTVTGNCDGSGGTVVSDTRTFYDGKGFGETPSRGDVTSVEEMTGDGKGYQVVERSEHDAYGRPTTHWDVNGNKTTTAYTPAAGASPVKTVVTNPLGHTQTIHADPVRGSTTAVVDTNGRRKDMAHDGLGRLTKLWDINRDKAAGKSPSAEYAYNISKTGPSATLTRSLKENGSYSTAVEIFDGMLRKRQTQDPGVGGGRLISDTVHDTQGRVVKTNDSYFAEGDVSETLLVVADTKVPHQSVTTYDGHGRPVKQVVRRYGEDQHATRAEYKGNESTVFPAKGDTAKTTFMDDEGRTTKLREYLDDDRSKYNDTSYSYNRKGQLTKVTDPDGNAWTFEYDARGRQIKATDPDKGTTTTTYDKDDRPVTVTDARGTKVSTTYDALDRPTSLRHGGPDGPKLTEWTYDSLLKGLPTASIRHIGGKEYRNEVTGYNQAYQPTGSQLVIPDSEGKLAGTYAYEHGYTAGVGLPSWTQIPSTGPLNKERLATRYNSDDLPDMLAGMSVYASGMQYSASSELMRSEAGVQGRKVYSTSFYDEHTRRLSRVVHDRDSKDANGSRIDDIGYDYDPAGNVTRIARTPGAAMPDGGRPDTQCFAYDALRRMTGAWTATDECKAAPSKETVGGPQAYWQSYTYDAVGNRTKLVEHDTSGDSAKDVTRTYAYPGAGKDQPRALTKVESKGPDGTSVNTYAYDSAGNMTIRQVGGNIQKLSYDIEGNLAKITEGDKSTENLYDADGNRLIHRAANGETTLYLGESELTVDAKGKLSATRYYEHPSGTTVRVAEEGDGTGGKGKQHLLLTDHHGSAETSVGLDQDDLPVQRRLLAPFGAERGTKPSSWPGKRGFVGGRKDESTGLTQLGAREYDPTTGRFISVDPIIDFGIPQQMNPYAYANNAPATESDPDGEFFPAVVVGAVWAARAAQAYRAWQAAQRLKRLQEAAERLRKAKEAADRAKKAKQLKDAAEKAKKAKAERDRKEALAKARAEKARKAKAEEAKKAREKAAAKQRPKPTAKPQQRPKPAPKPQARPKPAPKPKEVKPQGSRQFKQQVKSQAKEQVKDYVRSQAEGVSCPTPNSFVPGTPVHMADGTYKPIEEVKTGDLVLATNPETGETKAEPVVATIIGEGNKSLVRISVRADDGKIRSDEVSDGALISTEGHPFWVPELEKWVDAGELQPGQWLQTSAGTWVQITAVQAWTQKAAVRNLTVESTHTYYVGAGAVSVLAHNANCSSNAKILGDNMEAAGTVRPPETAAHHMVASTSPKAAAGRQQLAKFGIDINDAVNGVFLPRGSKSVNPTGASVHSRIHTNDYYATVNKLIGGARNRSEATDVLNHMRRQLLGGYWP